MLKEEQLKVGPWGGAASGSMQVKEQPKVGPKGEREGTSESNGTERHGWEKWGVRLFVD
jgi:hypothetical protein